MVRVNADETKFTVFLNERLMTLQGLVNCPKQLLGVLRFRQEICHPEGLKFRRTQRFSLSCQGHNWKIGFHLLSARASITPSEQYLSPVGCFS